jgi:hypothetical protein
MCKIIFFLNRRLHVEKVCERDGKLRDRSPSFIAFTLCFILYFEYKSGWYKNEGMFIFKNRKLTRKLKILFVVGFVNDMLEYLH